MGGKMPAEYFCWYHMIRRCTNPKAMAYHRWGGRGITVCERWMNYRNFLADMGKKPSGYRISIERIDNDGNYKPGNCRWATQKEQGNNLHNNIRLTLKGETLTLSQWADKLGRPYTTLYSRIVLRKWSLERALT